jgi:hypothetical protein
MAPGRFNTSRFISTAPMSAPMIRSDLILSSPFTAKKLPGAYMSFPLPASSMPKQYRMTGQWKIPAMISSHK